MAKHTPGPWLQYDPVTLKLDRRGLYIGAGEIDGEYISGQGRFITAIEPHSDYERCVADACLIETAPDLLSALKDARAHIAENSFSGGPSINPILASIDSVVAKAEGAKERKTADRKTACNNLACQIAGMHLHNCPAKEGA